MNGPYVGVEDRAPQWGNATGFVGVQDELPAYGNAAGDEDKAAQVAEKVGTAADKAAGVLGTIKGLADSFKGGGDAATEVTVEKKPTQWYLYGIGGLVLLVAIVFAFKKLA